MPNLHYLLFCMLGLVVPEGRKKAHLLPQDNDRQSTIQSLKKLDADFTDTEANQSAKLLINVLIEIGRTATHYVAGKAVGKAQKALQTRLKTTTHRKGYVAKIAKKPQSDKKIGNTNKPLQKNRFPKIDKHYDKHVLGKGKGRNKEWGNNISKKTYRNRATQLADAKIEGNIKGFTSK
ncbi:MAG: hypothetical protein AAF380_02465 [Bacteroidota bacterium]